MRVNHQNFMQRFCEKIRGFRSVSMFWCFAKDISSSVPVEAVIYLKLSKFRKDLRTADDDDHSRRRKDLDGQKPKKQKKKKQ